MPTKIASKSMGLEAVNDILMELTPNIGLTVDVGIFIRTDREPPGCPDKRYHDRHEILFQLRKCF